MLSLTILHIGLDKTGSTAIQLACLNNKRVLLENKILYPLSDFSHGQLGSCFYDDPVEYIHNIELARADRKQIEQEDQHYLQSLLDEIQQSNVTEMILSSEAFGFMDAPSVLRLRGFLSTISERVHVVLYCRPPLSYAVSALSQRARTGRPFWSDPPVQEIRKICQAYEDAFGRENITARAFVRNTLPDGDVRLDFFSLAGLSPDYVKRSMRLGVERDNSTLSAEAMLIAEALRQSHSDRPLANIEFSLKYESLLRTIRGGAIRLTQQQLAEVRSASREHIDYATRILNLPLEEPEIAYESSPPCFSKEALDSIAKCFRRLVELDVEPRNIAKDITTPDLIVGDAKLLGGADISYGSAISFEIDVLLNRPIQNLEFGIHIFDADHRWAFGTNTRLLGHKFTDVEPGTYRVVHHVIANLPIGSYSAGFAFTERLQVGEKQLAWFDSLCEFRISRSEDQVFAGYTYLPTEISLLNAPKGVGDPVVKDVSGAINVSGVPLSILSGKPFIASIEICNHGAQRWQGDIYRPINIAYRWLDAVTRQTVVEGGRIQLPNSGVPAGSIFQTEIQIIAPTESGPYNLMFTVLQEHVGWFDEIGESFQPALFDVLVEKMGDAAISNYAAAENDSTVIEAASSPVAVICDILDMPSKSLKKSRKRKRH